MNEAFFYIVVMIVLLIGNAVQAGRNVGRVYLAYIQVLVYAGTIVWFFFWTSPLFYFCTTLGFILSNILEAVELRDEKNIKNILFFMFSFLPTVFAVGLLSGVI
jgi:hypothetical protein